MQDWDDDYEEEEVEDEEEEERDPREVIVEDEVAEMLGIDSSEYPEGEAGDASWDRDWLQGKEYYGEHLLPSEEEEW